MRATRRSTRASTGLCAHRIGFADRLFMPGVAAHRRYAPSTLRMPSFLREWSEAVQALLSRWKLHQFIEQRGVVVTFKLETHPHHVLEARCGAHDHEPTLSVPV